MSVTVNDPYCVSEDPEMPFVSGALDPGEFQHHFSTCCRSSLPDTAGSIYSLAVIRVTRHKRGKRCLIEYDFLVERPGLPGETVTIIGKVRARGSARSRYRLLKSLWRAGFGDDSEDGISIPEPMGFIPEFNMWLQKKVPGIPATRLLTESDGVSLAGKIAAAIHKVHQTGISPKRSHTMADELRIIHERLPRIIDMNPAWARRVDLILHACDRLGATVPVTSPMVIHRDFYSDHALINKDRLYLIDFDLCCKGDPALDMGNFLGHIIEQSLRMYGDINTMRYQEKALEKQFLQLAGKRFRISLHVYKTLTLVRHIYISTRIPERRPFTEPLLVLCEKRLRATGHLESAI